MNLRKIENYASIIPKPTLSENANLLFSSVIKCFLVMEGSSIQKRIIKVHGL